MPSIALVVVAITALSPQPEHADWHCRNDVEVTCFDGSCETIVEEQHLPAEVTFNYSGEFSVCIGSGCWQGTGSILATSSFFIISKENADWSGSASLEKNVVIVFDLEDKVAVVKAWSLVLPLNCVAGVDSEGDRAATQTTASGR